MCINTRREGLGRTEQGSFQWCSVAGTEAMDTDWNTEGTSRSPFYCKDDRALALGWETEASIAGESIRASGHGSGYLVLSGLRKKFGSDELQNFVPDLTILQVYEQRVSFRQQCFKKKRENYQFGKEKLLITICTIILPGPSKSSIHSHFPITIIFSFYY